MSANFQSLIRSHVEADALSDGFRGIFSLGGRVLDAVRNLSINLDDAGKRQLKDAALAVYDVAAKAIDVPLVPDATELSIEAWLRSVLSEQIDKLLGLSLAV